MDFKGRDIISIRDFSREDFVYFIEKTKELEGNMARYSDLLKGKIVATLFFEPSTRTRLSFESAAHRLGASVIGFADPDVTSVKKGETLKDTIKILCGYADILVIRHPVEGSAKEAASVSCVPVINGGDGANEHPTQTLVDLYTIKKNITHIDGLTIGFLGDLKFGRTVHSLAYAMAQFRSKMVFISPEGLRMPSRYLKELDQYSISYREVADFSDALPELDVLYVTRIQKERFLDPKDYEKHKGFYRLDQSLLEKSKPSLKILHPLPRVDELDYELDGCPQSIYFQQAHNGIPVRMALLGLVSGAIR